MPRCGCANDQCSCFIEAGENVTVSGSGSQANPYVVSAAAPEVVVGPGGGGPSYMTGEIKMWPGSTIPDGWLLCDGQAISRSAYATLFGILSTTAGAGDGTSTFNLPNYTDRVPVGASGSKARNSQGGANSRTIAAANMPAHTHTMNHDHTMAMDGSHDHELGRVNAVGVQSTSIPRGDGAPTSVSRLGIENDGVHNHVINDHLGSTGSVGSGTALDTTPAYVAVNFIIKT